MANNDGSLIERALIEDLYPYPSIFIGVKRDLLLDHARALPREMPQPSLLYQKLMDHSTKEHWLHQITYTCGVEFADGKTAISSHSKGIEYGCTVDAVLKLSYKIESKRSKGVPPVLLIQTDQFGNLHSPSAVARSYLLENGFGYLKILIHH